ncbi:DUF1963 domain-containing protein [Virgisporangium aurantiacum]|uniref:DUF1963 domain-containing protein n=1 Tax=Virgisporangium aurantiacum TaxID=175570 RepID=A0A8J3ZJ20_9ACTN|nr:DUF1963 domain-containing protein [Virgisporangium aurantiacum]GIJ64711.1 hypothetical protein Vau01_122270 [Virgisporangium aurantiacum]
MYTNESLRGYLRKAQELGIPEPVTNWMLQLARPRVVLHRDGDFRFGSGPAAATAPIVGFVGGNPLLPDNVEWNGFPHFIASVDCGALPPDVLDFPFPHNGTLLFFANAEQPDFSTDEEDTCGRIVYIQPGTPTSERAPHEDFRPFLTERFPLRSEIVWTMPQHASPEYLQLTGETRDLFDKYHGAQIGNEPWPYCGQLALGGHVAVVQSHPLERLMPDDIELFDGEGNPHEMATAAATRRPEDLPLPHFPDLPMPDAEWVTIAEMTDDLKWGPPISTTYWSVRRVDLAEQRFDRVKYHIDIM